MRVAALVTICGWSLAAQQPFLLRKDIVVSLQRGPGWFLSRGVMADFDGDGKTDVGFCWLGSQTVLVNRGGGDFGPPIGGPELCGDVAGDFNSDGRVDLLSLTGSILFGRGDGTFAPPSRIAPPEGPNPRIVTAGDLNRDGRSDLVYYTSPDSEDEPVPVTVHVMLGAGNGSFSAAGKVEYPPDRLPYSIVVADFNRDDIPDLAGGVRSELRVLLGNGNGSFRDPVATAIGEDSGALIASDFNRDGFPDLASSRFLALGKGDGSFLPPSRNPLPEMTSKHGPPSMLQASAAADFNGDGHLDLAGLLFYGLPGSAAREVWVLPGRGDGTLLPPVKHAVGLTVSLNAADVDQDGSGDLVTINSLSNSVSLLLSRRPGGPHLNRAVSAASGTAIVAPGSLATIHAAVQGVATTQAQPPWPVSLAGVSLEITDSAGATRLAPLLYVSASQINFQVPSGIALGEATLKLVNASGSTAAGGVHVGAAAPSLFVVDIFPFLIPRAAAVAIRIEADGTQTVLPLVNCTPEGICFPEFPASDGRPLFISFFGTGFRHAGSSKVTCSANGSPLAVEYAGPQATPGVDQINVRVPQGSQGLGTVVCEIGGVVTNPVWL